MLNIVTPKEDPLEVFIFLFESVMTLMTHEMLFFGMTVTPLDFALFIGVANLLVDIIWLVIKRGRGDADGD